MGAFRTRTRTSRPLVFAAALLAAVPVAATAGALPADKCEASKNKIAGAYYACVEKAEATAILKALPPDHSKCTAKFLAKWGTAETKGAGACPDTITLPQDMADYLAAQAAEATSVIGGANIPTCTADLASCRADLAALGAGCDAPFTCPAPTAANRHTICGQLFDLEDGSRFQAIGAAGTECTTPTVEGPCSLKIVSYDALDFAANPGTAAPLPSGPIYIDDCGRYRVPDITIPSLAFIELVIDDADVAKQGPTGSTNTVGVTTPTQAGAATPDFDGWVASKATTDNWESSGGPPVSGGLYIPIFYERVPTMNRDLQDGVTITATGSLVPLRDHYFVATESARRTIDPTATATGINGTVLVTGASMSEGVAYSGIGGGLSSDCQWETHMGTSLANILSVQDFRPQDAIGQTCDR